MSWLTSVAKARGKLVLLPAVAMTLAAGSPTESRAQAVTGSPNAHTSRVATTPEASQADAIVSAGTTDIAAGSTHPQTSQTVRTSATTSMGIATSAAVPATAKPSATATGASTRPPAPASRAGSVIPYERTPGATTDSLYTLSVNGQAVAVDHAFDVAYARFALSGIVSVTVGVGQPVRTYSVSPRSYNISAVTIGNALVFSLGNPADLIVTVNGMEKLFIFADPVEVSPPSPRGPGIVSLSSYITDNTGTVLQTTQFQTAINAAAAQNGGAGGVLYVPDGAYLTGSLLLRSNVAVYLQSGARIQGSGNPSDYTGGALIRTGGATHARIFGRGVIDGNGTTLRPAGAKHNILKLTGGQNLEVDDVLLRDSASWTVHVSAVAHATLRNVKVVNNLALGVGLDGIDPDSSTDVTITGAFIYTYDDCFAVKTTPTANQPADHILVENAVCWTQKSALKVGTESVNSISNVTFSGDNVVHADRALAIYMGGGGNLRNLSYTGDFSETIGADGKQRLIDFEVTAGQASNVTVTDYAAYSASPNASIVEGTAGASLTVAFTRLVVAGRLCSTAAGAQIAVSNAIVTFR